MQNFENAQRVIVAREPSHILTVTEVLTDITRF